MWFRRNPSLTRIERQLEIIMTLAQDNLAAIQALQVTVNSSNTKVDLLIAGLSGVESALTALQGSTGLSSDDQAALTQGMQVIADTKASIDAESSKLDTALAAIPSTGTPAPGTVVTGGTDTNPTTGDTSSGGNPPLEG